MEGQPVRRRAARPARWCGWRSTGARWCERSVCFGNELGRIRDVRQGPDGWLYLLTDMNDGRILRLELP